MHATRCVIALLLGSALLAANPSPVGAVTVLDANLTGLVVVESQNSFDDTWNTIVETLEANPNIKVVATIDHARAAQSAGLDLEPNRVVVFGNPNLGTPVMQASQTAGLDLPQKMQVFSEDGRTYVAFNSVQYLGSRHWTDPLDSYSKIHAALTGIAQKATGVRPNADHINVVDSVGQVTGLTTKTSDSDFETTWDRLTAAIEASPANIAFTVDHSVNAAGVGLTLRPTRVVVFGNPNVGTPLMQANPTAGLDLPLKIVVWVDESGQTRVTSTVADFLAARHDLPSGIVAPVAGATGNFLAAAAG